MITKITESNKQFYNALFQDINSSIEGLEIQTIEDYFRNLVTIGQYVKGRDDKDYFMRLPADEEIFQINANTRVINVPAAFRSNGIAVVGDQYAETLWFKIDKYYDIQDLGAKNVSIRIYWEQPGTKIAGYSVPQYHDVWSEAGQLYFGWVIPGIITKNAGNLVFSIRFTSGGTPENPEYAYSTLPQTLKVNDTPFKADMRYEEDGTDRISVLDRLTNSTSSAIYIPRPIFSHEISADYAYIPAEGNVLRAAAYSERMNGLAMEYYWYAGGNRIDDSEVSVDWIQTTDTEVNVNKYYYSDKGEEFLYINDDDIQAALNSPDAIVYEKGSKITITDPGSYQVKAIAAYDDDGTKIYSRPEYSDVVYFELPTPVQPADITFESSLNGIIGNTEDAIPVITFACNMGPGQQSYATCDINLYVGEKELVEAYTDVADDVVKSYEVTEEGDYYVEVVKKLNGVSADAYTSNKVNIQRQAVMATVNVDPAETLVSVGSSVNFTYENNNTPNHTYKYVLYYSSTNTVDNTSSVYGRWEVAPESVQLTKSGSYKMYVQSIYGRSVETYKESPKITVWTI